MAVFKLCFPTFSILYCIHFFSKPPKAQRAGETVAMGDHSCGEAASKCRGDSAPVRKAAGVLGTPQTKDLSSKPPAQRPTKAPV